MNFIDSNIIAYAFYANPFQENCRNIIREGGLINTLILIEAFNIIELQTSRDIAQKAIKGLLKSQVQIIPVDLNMIFEALKRSSHHQHLKFLDLVHYTTTQLHQCDAIFSYDRDFDGLDIQRKER
ncbi:MAG TPA: PIN domain-containing protein [Candidatus Nanoarchaeia archaeon]|nr:PIN domain-containing protein [Candidatus Nanoarchaeia archaeon]